MPRGGPTVIIDYGMGNLRSVEKAVASVGGDPVTTGDPDAIRSAPRLILPGVGAFGDAMSNLRAQGLVEAILEVVSSGRPLLGLCLGLQLLFDESEEFGRHSGLGIIPGRVRRFSAPELHVPHVGWNQIQEVKTDPLLEGVPEGAYFYFVHSYYVEPVASGDQVALTEYGLFFCSIARHGNVWGAQFHPEKSQAMGKRLLGNFVRLE